MLLEKLQSLVCIVVITRCESRNYDIVCYATAVFEVYLSDENCWKNKYKNKNKKEIQTVNILNCLSIQWNG